MMSSAPLFLIVEGRKSDRPFYERVLRQVGGLGDADFKLYVSDDFSLDGNPGSGKNFLLELHAFWAASRFLHQTNSRGDHVIALALDRDLDHLTGRLVDTKHILYSRGADVEADVLYHGDMVQAVADAFSLTRTQAREILPPDGVFNSLLHLWREWIIIGARSSAIGGSLSYGKLSLVNGRNHFEPLDYEQLRFFSGILDQDAAARGLEGRASDVERAAQEVLDGPESWRVLKGKWVSAYLHHLVEEQRGSRLVIEAGVASETIAKTCLAGMTLDGPIRTHYRSQLERLLPTILR